MCFVICHFQTWLECSRYDLRMVSQCSEDLDVKTCLQKERFMEEVNALPEQSPKLNAVEVVVL